MIEDNDRNKAVRNIELQLHEQYAQNNNANMSSIITLIAATLAIFYAFGYMYIHSSIEFSDSCLFVFYKEEKYTLDAMILTSAATLIVLYILKYVCLYQGYKQRFEQFITYAIRCKYYGMNPEKLNPRIYPDNYNPFKYAKDGSIDVSEIPQGLFGELVKLFHFLILFLMIMLIIKVSLNVYHYYKPTPIPSCGILWLFFFFVEFICCRGAYCEGKTKLIKKYKDLCDQFKEYNPTLLFIKSKEKIQYKINVSISIKDSNINIS